MDKIISCPATREKQIIALLHTKYRGASKIEDLVKELPLTKRQLLNTHVRKSPYLENNKGIIRLCRSGKDVFKHLRLSKRPYETETIAQFVQSVFWIDLNTDYITMCRKLKQWGVNTGKPIGDFCRNKSKHYDYYRKIVKRYYIASGRLEDDDI